MAIPQLSGGCGNKKFNYVHRTRKKQVFQEGNFHNLKKNASLGCKFKKSANAQIDLKSFIS
jgi:hypothetical protein